MFLLQSDAIPSAAQSGLRIFGDYSFADPLFLLLVPAALLLFWWGRRASARARGRVSMLPSGFPRSARQRFLWFPSTLHLVALLCAIFALARPLRGNVQHDVVSECVDIALVVDRSGSMAAPDLEKGRTRLDVVKEVVGDFAERRMSDREGAADNCALISFARYPLLLCPFTLDHEALTGFLDEIQLALKRGEDGTGIGVALAKAVAVLRQSEAKSRIVVLLTDGENNVPTILPRDAAELAAEEGIRVYTVFSARYVCFQDPFGGWQASEEEPNTAVLEEIAELTEGRFFRAYDKQSLEDIYAEIEELERTERKELRYEETFDLYPWLLLPAALAYALAWLSQVTWARRGP